MSPLLPGVFPSMDHQTIQAVLDNLIDALAAEVAERLASQTPGPNTSNDELLTTEQAAKVTGIPKKTLESYRSRGLGPEFVRHGRLIRYRRRDLLKAG